MSDTGGLSKAAKKNKKKNERKKKASGATSTNPKGKPTPPHRPVDLLPLLKEELEVAKSAQDHTRASKLREQIWVLNDIVKGVKTDMPKSDLEPIISSIQQMLNINEPESTSKSPSSSGVDAEKRIKKLQKKLSSIEELKERQAKGESLEQSQVKKVESEEQILDEIEELERLLAEAKSQIGK